MSAILIGYSACDLTAEAFADHGHDVWTCDLLPSRGWHKHLQMDVWEAIESRAWDFGVFHPMCTYLTVSAAWAFKDGPYHQKVKPGTLVGAERRAAREEALDNFRRLLGLPFPVGCENPSPSFINKAICRPTQVVQPWWFGDDASKSTGLWLTKGTPPLWSDERDYAAPRYCCQDCGKTMHGYAGSCSKCGGERVRERWSNQTDSGQNKLGPSDPNRWLARSATYPGIAAAMGDQWGRWLRERVA